MCRWWLRSPGNNSNNAANVNNDGSVNYNGNNVNNDNNGIRPALIPSARNFPWVWTVRAWDKGIGSLPGLISRENIYRQVHLMLWLSMYAEVWQSSLLQTSLTAPLKKDTLRQDTSMMKITEHDRL